MSCSVRSAGSNQTCSSCRSSTDYWIVDLDARTFERTTPADERPEIVTAQIIWQPEGATEPLMIDVANYFAAVLDEG
ncbi:MAG TPA: hypothetical protein VH277_06125 [Gemmatimonadaceae bacterium]|jgi:hypothetical protein|nr:hypothetical protein [Gemmatimonadaceae bacterium]